MEIKGIVEIGLAVILVAGIFTFSDHLEYLTQYGLIGAFLISLIGSATIILPTPSAAIIFAMSAYIDPLALGIVAGIGSGLGELTGYFAGDGARKMLKSKIKESKKIEEIIQKYGSFGVFFLAFIPNPLFDAAGIIAGGSGVHWSKFILAAIAGRILRYILLSELGLFASNFVG